MQFQILTTCLLLFQAYSEAANILFFFGVSTYSHRVSVWPLVERLANRGDNVTFFQPIRPKKTHPRVKDFLPFEEMQGADSLATRLEHGRMGNVWAALDLPGLGIDICQKFLSNPETAVLLKDAKFDLIIIDSLFNECAYGLAHKFRAKTIIYGTSAVMVWWYDTFGFPAETSWIPELHLSFPYPMNFGERLISTFVALYAYYGRAWAYYPMIEDMLREKLNVPNMPPIRELERQTSLILMNTHFGEEVARSLPPLVIPVGGMHCEIHTGTDIPKDIQDFIQGAGDAGFIFVSFGSAIKISDAPEAVRNVFYTAFGNSNVRFLWKYDGPRPKEMPSNVITAAWMPQQEILALKPKAFITHGGLLSIQEAIMHEVPMIAVPVFAEQDYNSFRLQRTGRGIKLEISTLTISELESAISEILSNDTYKENIVKTSKIFKDRPRPPIDEALWWVDYVLRNENTDHLKPLSINQYWFQRRLLDVWAFIFVVVFLITFICIRSIYALFQCICVNTQTVHFHALNVKNSVKSSDGKIKVKKS